MQDKELYQQILGIEKPWKVVGVELDVQDGEVRVHVAHLEPKPPCPQCGRPCSRYDKRPRRWRHLDTCQYPTILIADVGRVQCETHGVLQMRVPWAAKGSKFTELFEALVIDWLKETSISAVARLFGLSWESVDGILQRAVRRGLQRRRNLLLPLPQHLGVDETSFKKRHDYVTVVIDQDDNTVIHVAEGRGRDSLDAFFEGFARSERAEVESVAMDMHGPYIAAVSDAIPGAERKIAFDRFHVASHMGEAVNQVRRQEHKALKARDINPLTGTRYLWLKSPEELEGERRERLELLKDSSLKTARAWAIKSWQGACGTTRSEAGRAAAGCAGTAGRSVRDSSR